MPSALPGLAHAVFDVDALAQRTAVLAEALQRRGLAKAEAIVLIGRAAVELKQLQLPPAPDDELPDMVRFLAQREFHALAAGVAARFLAEPGRRAGRAALSDGRGRRTGIPAAQVRQLIEGAGLRTAADVVAADALRPR